MWFVTWNAMGLVVVWRAEEVSVEVQHADIAVITSTQLRGGQAAVARHLPFHTSYSLGWSDGAYTNRATSILIMLGKRFFGNNKVECKAGPQEPGGRVATVRVRPTTSASSRYTGRRAPWSRASSRRLVTAFAPGWTRRSPRRGAPWCCDLNNGMDIRRVAGEQRIEADEVVGVARPTGEHLPTTILRSWARRYSMCVVCREYVLLARAGLLCLRRPENLRRLPADC